MSSSLVSFIVAFTDLVSDVFLNYRNNKDADSILVSNRIFSGEENYKYLCYMDDNYIIKPLRIVLPKTST